MGELLVNLTDEELVYLVAAFDGDILPGISDPYDEFSDSEKADRIIEVEQQLQDRGYRKRGFGGKVDYDADISEMIKICASFEKYIGFDKRIGDENLTTQRFYEKDGKWLQISGDSEEFNLQIKTADEVKTFLDEIPKDIGSKSNQISILIPRDEYDEVAELIQDGNVEEARESLKKYNLDEFNEMFLIDGLSYKLAYAAITLVARDDGNLSVDTVSALISDEAMAELYVEAEEGEVTKVGFRKADTGSWPKFKGVINEWLIAS